MQCVLISQHNDRRANAKQLISAEKTTTMRETRQLIVGENHDRKGHQPQIEFLSSPRLHSDTDKCSLVCTSDDDASLSGCSVDTGAETIRRSNASDIPVSLLLNTCTIVPCRQSKHSLSNSTVALLFVASGSCTDRIFSTKWMPKNSNV